MAFEFKIAVNQVSADGSSVVVDDASNWVDNVDPRTDFALFMLVDYRLSTTPVVVTPTAYDPMTVDSWTIPTDTDGRYTSSMYSFFTQSSGHVAVAGDVQYNTVSALLQQYDGSIWTQVQLEDVLDKAVHSAVLEIPILSKSYIYKNNTNLDYIRVFRDDVSNGSVQNKLYYKRTNLDYTDALITGAEYNWGLQLYTNFYSIVSVLNTKIATDKQY